MKKNLSPVLILAISFMLGGAYVGYKFHGTPSAGENVTSKPSSGGLFEQQLPDASGVSQPLSRWRGKPLIVNFWATWCAPCVEEMPELSAFQTELHAKDIQLIGIGVDSAENIRNFSSKYRISYPLYIAGANGVELSRQLGNLNGGLPFTVLFDKNGTVVRTYLGRLHLEQLRSDLAAL